MRNIDDDYPERARYLRFVQYLDAWKRNIVDKWDEFGDINSVDNDILTYVVTAHATIEEFSSRLINKYVIDDRFSDEAYEYIYSNMSQGHREQLLKECGIFGNSISGDLSDFRGLRNKLAHEPYPAIHWRDDRIEERLTIAVERIEQLYDALYEEELVEKAIDGDGF